MISQNQDQHNDLLLDKHLEGDNSELSNCCEAEILDTLLCSRCKEQCITISDEYEMLRYSADDDRIEEMKER